MNAWMNLPTMNMAAWLAEDAGAPELRNPRNSGIRSSGWLSRIFRKRR